MAHTSEESVRGLSTLAGELKKLETEYNQFFSGRLPRPPWETRTRVESLMRKWDRQSFQASSADKFKFQTMQARYATFADLWEPVLALLAISTVLIAVSARAFKKTVS